MTYWLLTSIIELYLQIYLIFRLLVGFIRILLQKLKNPMAMSYKLQNT